MSLRDDNGVALVTDQAALGAGRTLGVAVTAGARWRGAVEGRMFARVEEKREKVGVEGSAAELLGRGFLDEGREGVFEVEARPVRGLGRGSRGALGRV